MGELRVKDGMSQQYWNSFRRVYRYSTGSRDPKHKAYSPGSLWPSA